jgi:hypothetical protein
VDALGSYQLHGLPYSAATFDPSAPSCPPNRASILLMLRATSSYTAKKKSSR